MTFVRCPFVDDCLGVLPDGDAGGDGEEMTEDIGNTTTLMTNTSELEGCRVSLLWFVLVVVCSSCPFLF
jgi:hypothetical protein